MRLNKGSSGREFLRQLYEAAVNRVSPYQMVKDRVSLGDGSLEILNASVPLEIPLSDYNRVMVVGAGKASAPMALALEEILIPEQAAELEVRNFDGIVSVKYGHTSPTQYIRLIEAGHPLPDENSIRAGSEIAALLKTADEHTLVINLISGGGSALLAGPWPGLEYEQIQEMNQVLLDCGAGIHEINTLRKHTSGLKGGRLAELAYPGILINIILSDVVGDDVEVIASGPGVPDPSSFEDVWEIIDKYMLEKDLPTQILEHFQRGRRDPSLETPKPGAPLLSACTNDTAREQPFRPGGGGLLCAGGRC